MREENRLIEHGFAKENDRSNPCWFAVWTRSRQEKLAAAMLGSLGIHHFLPIRSEIRQWSDRRQNVAVPLFSGYLFVRINPAKDTRLSILRVPGVAGLVGNHSGPVPIPERQIEDIQTVLATQTQCVVLPLLEEGDMVRVVRGPLAGVEGRLLRGNSAIRLVISIELIHQSLAINVSREDVELVAQRAA